MKPENRSPTVQFALRDLFWSLLVAGLACGWWVDRANIDHQEREIGRLKRQQLEMTTATEGDYVRMHAALKRLQDKWAEETK
jgi:hypothetical protein